MPFKINFILSAFIIQVKTVPERVNKKPENLNITKIKHRGRSVIVQTSALDFVVSAVCIKFLNSCIVRALAGCVGKKVMTRISKKNKTKKDLLEKILNFF